MHERAIDAAFEAVRAETYERLGVFSSYQISSECEAVIEAVSSEIDIDNITNYPDGERDEAWREEILRESFIRVFEAGFRVGLEAGKESIEVRLNLTSETIAGLVQQALQGNS